MNVTCQQCKSKLNIPESKLVQGKEAVFKCPKCKEKITVPPVNRKAPSSLDVKDIAKKAFDDRENAMICIDDPANKKKAFSMLSQMGFNAETVIDVKDALDRMEYHIYHLIILDEDFDEKKGAQQILRRMNSIDTSLRRQICLVLISSRFNSNDSMAALHSSVNNIIHSDDISYLDSFLSQIIMDHKNFYTVYNDSLKQTGRA